MTAAESIRLVRALNGLTRTQLARMAGVSPSTVTRIEAGLLDPSYSMWEKLLNSAGYRASTDLEPVGDDVAVAAARELLTGADFGLPETRLWKERWVRAGLTGWRDLPAIALQAGSASPLRTRAGFRQASSDRPWQHTARDLESHGICYALSGLSAASGGDRISGSATPVIYVEDIGSPFDSGALLPTPSGGGPSIIVLPFDPVSRRGVWRDSAGYSWIERLHALIDSYGGPGRMADNAELIAEQLTMDDVA